MKWHIGLSQNPKPQSHRLSSFYPSKVFKHVILGVSLFSDTQLLYHMLLIVIYIIHMCISLLVLPFADLRFNDTISISVRENICMICFFFPVTIPNLKCLGHTQLSCCWFVCVSHYYPHNGWYSVWTIPHYYILYCWLNCYCIMFILIIITKHTHYIQIYIYTYTHTYENTYVYNGILT
jgi:hypothetical protein